MITRSRGSLALTTVVTCGLHVAPEDDNGELEFSRVLDAGVGSAGVRVRTATTLGEGEGG